MKSGSEWISTVALEAALIAHSSVAEAVVVAVPHHAWGRASPGRRLAWWADEVVD